MKKSLKKLLIVGGAFSAVAIQTTAATITNAKPVTKLIIRNTASFRLAASLFVRFSTVTGDLFAQASFFLSSGYSPNTSVVLLSDLFRSTPSPIFGGVSNTL